jgi:hypothetical protein
VDDWILARERLVPASAFLDSDGRREHICAALDVVRGHGSFLFGSFQLKFLAEFFTMSDTVTKLTEISQINKKRKGVGIFSCSQHASDWGPVLLRSFSLAE